MEKKDLATPRHSNDTRRRRVARRAAKLPTRFGKVQVKLQLNCISSLLAGVRKPTNAFERCLYKDALIRAHSVKAVSFVENTLFACGACAAKQGRDCICSGVAFLYARVDNQQLTEFSSGIRSPYNPVYEPFDPDDQEKLQAALEVGVSLLPESSSPLVRCRHLLRLVYVAAMTGLASTVEASAPFWRRVILQVSGVTWILLMSFTAVDSTRARFVVAKLPYSLLTSCVRLEIRLRCYLRRATPIFQVWNVACGFSGV